MRTSLSLIGIAIFFSVPLQSSAQEANARRTDIEALQSFYEFELKQPEDSYLKKRIADERRRIRERIEEELAASFAPDPENTLHQNGELKSTLERQRAIVTQLTELLSDRKIDLDILAAEEQRYYREQKPDPGVNDSYRLTKSHSELLARRAALEESVEVLTSLQTLHSDRLAKLQRTQLAMQFSTAITATKYLILIVVVWLIERLIQRTLLSSIADPTRRYMATKFVSTATYTILILVLLGMLLSSHPGILASIAIIGAGLAIALQDVVKDILGRFLIMQNRLFVRGDRITIGQTTGEVIDVSLLRTTLLEVGTRSGEEFGVLERTGRIISVPNAQVLSHTLTNHHTTSNFVRAEMHFSITFESNWRKAKGILENILEEETGEYVREEEKQARKRTRKYYIPHRTRGNKVYLDIADDGVQCTLRFTIPIGERRPTVTRISDKVLECFLTEDDITLAYRTSRILSEVRYLDGLPKHHPPNHLG